MECPCHYIIAHVLHAGMPQPYNGLMLLCDLSRRYRSGICICSYLSLIGQARTLHTLYHQILSQTNLPSFFPHTLAMDASSQSSGPVVNVQEPMVLISPSDHVRTLFSDHRRERRSSGLAKAVTNPSPLAKSALVLK